MGDEQGDPQDRPQAGDDCVHPDGALLRVGGHGDAVCQQCGARVPVGLTG